MNKNLQTYSNWIEYHLNKSQLELKNFTYNNVKYNLFVLRDDYIHPLASGNKLRKLKYNIIQACLENCQGIITYGGAYSNHILATSSVANELKIPLKIFIRGDELSVVSNGILKICHELGCELIFVSRTDYKKMKYRSGIVNIEGYNFWSIPEGGANTLGVKGCKEINNIIGSKNYFKVVLPIGSGTTLLGLYSSMSDSTSFLVSTISNNFDVKEHIMRIFDEKIDSNRIIKMNFSEKSKFGKISSNIKDFVVDFNESNKTFKLDPLYTGKAIFGLLQNDQFLREHDTNSYLFIHTGGVNQSLWS